MLRTPFEVFVVRRGGRNPVRKTTNELARRFTRELRLGVEHREPTALDLLRRLAVEIGTDFSAQAVELAAAPVVELLLAALAPALASGRLVVEQDRIASLSERRDMRVPELPPLPAAAREASTRTFEVRFVDEIGTAIGGIEAEFSADGPQTRTTNPAGIALLEGVQATSATVAILDAAALDTRLESRWEKLRPGQLPKESNTTEVVFRRRELGPFPLKAELPNRIVIKPPLAKISAQLFDKTGRVVHAKRPFTLDGPQAVQGTTDDDGRIEVPDVFQGDYTLSLTIESFKGDPDETVEIVTSPIVALDVVGEPQARMLGAVPISILARLHLFFNTNKAFLLPTALASMQKLRRLYIENAPCKLLVVGHADTKGGPAFNDKLSLARARATIAYLKDDVQAWLAFYDEGDPKQAWGKVEDHLMLLSMPDFGGKSPKEDEVRWFQRTRGLSVDGVAGKQTRRALIEEYMSLDGSPSWRWRTRTSVPIAPSYCRRVKTPIKTGSIERSRRSA